MGISERQFDLIQEAAKLLMEDVRLTLEEAINLITTCIKIELVKRNVTMETLNASSLSDRTAFTRAIVHNVQQKIIENPNWRAKNLAASIEKFYKVLHKSWIQNSI